MAKRNKMMKFVVPAAIAMGRGALSRWPILVAALGGAMVHRVWSNRRMRKLSASTASTWTDEVETSSSRPSGTTRTGSSSTPTTDAWSPTAPTGL